MARSHGRLLARIWSDADFRVLSSGAQRVYMLLISQANLTQAGTIPLTIRRWASMASDTGDAEIESALRELEMSRFVVIDGTSQELLVRTLIRNDGVYKQPMIFRSAKGDAELVSSRKLRRALVSELRTLPIVNAQVKADCEELIEALIDPEPDPPKRVSETLNEGSGEPFQGPFLSDETRFRVARAAPTPTPTPTPCTPPASAPTLHTRAAVITDDYYEAVDRMCKWPAIQGIVKRAINAGAWTDQEIHAAVLRLAAENRPMTVDTLRIELTGFNPRTRPNPADERLHHGQGIVLSLRRRENQTREIS